MLERLLELGPKVPRRILSWDSVGRIDMPRCLKNKVGMSSDGSKIDHLGLFHHFPLQRTHFVGYGKDISTISTAFRSSVLKGLAQTVQPNGFFF